MKPNFLRDMPLPLALQALQEQYPLEKNSSLAQEHLATFYNSRYILACQWIALKRFNQGKRNRSPFNTAEGRAAEPWGDAMLARLGLCEGLCEYSYLLKPKPCPLDLSLLGLNAPTVHVFHAPFTHWLHVEREIKRIRIELACQDVEVPPITAKKDLAQRRKHHAQLRKLQNPLGDGENSPWYFRLIEESRKLADKKIRPYTYAKFHKNYWEPFLKAVQNEYLYEEKYGMRVPFVSNGELMVTGKGSPRRLRIKKLETSQVEEAWLREYYCLDEP